MEHSPESIPETGVGVKISVTDLSIVRTVVDRFASRVNAVAVAWNLYQSKTVQTMGFTSESRKRSKKRSESCSRPIHWYQSCQGYRGKSYDHLPTQILELFDYKQFVSYVVQMWYKEINNNSECNKKKKFGNCTDYLLIFIDFSCCLYWKIEKFCNFASEFISQLRKGNRRTQAIDALRLLLL